MPLPCPKCGALTADNDRRCGSCGASMAQTTRFQASAPGAAPAPVSSPTAMIERNRLEQAEKDRISDLKLRRRWVRHGIAGMIVFFVLRGLLDFTAFFQPMAMLWNVIAAVVLGFPMGFIISRMNADRYKGLWVGGLTTLVILGGINLMMSGEFDPTLLFFCFMVGAFPGFAIGMHCELDR